MRNALGFASTAAAMCCLLATTVAAAPPQPPTRKTDPSCEWVWKTGGGVGIWTEACNLTTGKWQVDWKPEINGFQLVHDGKPVTTVLQIFNKKTDEPASAILPELRAKQLIADTPDCVFQSAAIRPAPRTIAFLEIRPTGERLKAFEATPKDEVPEPPCGDYGWSTNGVRYFQSDLRRPDRIVYIDEGQDGTMFDPASLTFE